MAHLQLLNKRIVVTRAEEQSWNVAAMLRKAGAIVILVPTITIIPAVLSQKDEACISSFYGYDVVIFPSVNSVKNFFTKITIDKYSPVTPYIVAIGSKTAESVAEFGFAADFVPVKFASEVLMKSLAEFEWKAKRVLIPAGNLSNDELIDLVESKGAVADKVVVYETVPNDSIDGAIKEEIRSRQFDAIIFYSPSQVKNFISIFGAEVLNGKRIATIGPTTKKTVEHYGLEVAIVPDKSTTEDLIACLCRSGFAQAGGSA
ncbi:MAG: uroporphyrinogen-III synthase [Candidatus Kryptoniota bacterium]